MKAWRAVAAAFVVMLALAPAASAQSGGGRWYRGESANFIVFGDSEGQVAGAAQALEDFHKALAALLRVSGESDANKLEVYLVRGQVGLREIWPTVGDSIGGFYMARSEHTAAFLIYNQSFATSRLEILQHEYAHHFMMHYAPQAYPRWYVEGWAEFVSTMEVRDRRAIIGRPSRDRLMALADRNFIAIEHFLAPERMQNEPSTFGGRFYAQSAFAATYIANNSTRAEGLVRYVDALGRGEEPLEAFEPSFGISTREFNDELRAYTRGTAQLIAVPLPAERADVTVTRLPRSADDLLLPYARMKLSQVGQDDVPAFTSRIEREAPAFPGDPLAELARVRAAMLRDDNQGARTRLEAFIATNDTAEARFLLGMTYLNEVETAQPGEATDEAIREARRHFVRGFRIDANHAPTLVHYARSYAGGPPMADEHINVLARAVELAPQVSSTRMLLASELMEREEFDAAVVTLRPLMYAGHGDDTSRMARAMADAARRGEQYQSSAVEDAEEIDKDADGTD
jgi:tetratricopeptide (TPR) repeat protein